MKSPPYPCLSEGKEESIPVIRCEPSGKWSMVHICEGENYLQRGPYDDKGAPAYSQHYSCEFCALIEVEKRNERIENERIENE